MKKKHIRQKKTEMSAPVRSAVFSMDPDSYVVPSEIVVPSWVYGYHVELEKTIDDFLKDVKVDPYMPKYMKAEIDSKIGAAKAEIYKQYAANRYTVEERRRAQAAKLLKLQEQAKILEQEIAEYEQELADLDCAWGNRGPLM